MKLSDKLIVLPSLFILVSFIIFSISRLFKCNGCTTWSNLQFPSALV